MLNDILVLSLCGFLGNVGVGITGFGMAIIYIFVWQVSSLSGYDGTDFKYAIFIQSLALASVQPILLYKTNVKKHASRKMLFWFIPITILSTPLGQLTSEYVSTEIVKSVGGILVFLISLRELYMNRSFFFPCLSKTTETKDEQEDEKEQKKDQTDTLDVNQTHKIEDTEGSDNITGQEDKNQDLEVETQEVPKASEVDQSKQVQELDNKQPLGPGAIFWTLFAGFASGYLGGFCGIRGPPLIIYFLYPPSPVVFTKSSQRSTGACITAANVSMRVLFYIIESVSAKKGGPLHGAYFKAENWYLYVIVMVFSLLGLLVGDLLFKKIGDRKDVIRGVLTIMLFLCGVSLILTSFAFKK